MTAPLEDGTFASGGVVYPLVSPGTNSILQDADPAIYFATAFFQQMLTTHLADRWAVECTAAGGAAAAVSTTIVKSTSSFEPYSHMQELQALLPLLAVYRISAKSRDLSLQRVHREGVIKVDWIMPPLAAAQMLRLAPFLKAVFDVLDSRSGTQTDPSYSSGDSPWDQAGIEECGFTDYQLGNMKGAGDLVFPTMSATFMCIERDEFVVGAFPVLTATTTAVGLVSTTDPPDTTINPFVTVDTTPEAP